MLKAVIGLLLITADGDDDAPAPPADAGVVCEALGFLEFILLFFSSFGIYLFSCVCVFDFLFFFLFLFLSNFVCICFSCYFFSSVLLLSIFISKVAQLLCMYSFSFFKSFSPLLLLFRMDIFSTKCLVSSS